MSTGRIPGLSDATSLGGKVTNDLWPLGLMPQRADLKSKPRRPKPDPTPIEPSFYSGNFVIDISGPVALQGPSMGYMGMYDIDPDAMMHLQFVGEVSLPPGTWTVGIVQNLVWCNHIEKYDHGGQIKFAIAENLLDVLVNASSTEIFLDTLGNAKVTLVSPALNGGFKHKVSLDAGDTPRKLRGYPATRTRCQNKISEVLEDVDVSNIFSAALVACKDGVVHQLVVTDDKYGYRYRFEVPSGGGQPDRTWLDFTAFRSKKLLRPTDGERFKNALLTTDRKKPTANEITNRLAWDAIARYTRDCFVKNPAP